MINKHKLISPVFIFFLILNNVLVLNIISEIRNQMIRWKRLLRSAAVGLRSAHHLSDKHSAPAQ